MSIKIALAVFTALLLVLPLPASALITTSINDGGLYTTGTDSQLTLMLNNYDAGLVTDSVITIANSTVNDVSSAMFLDQSGWIRLAPYQNGSDVVAGITTNNGFITNGSRIINLRFNFNTPKTYVLGFSLYSDNNVISSAAAPITVSGPQVLGTSTTVVFSRPLKYGSRGSDVTALQQKLTAEGFYNGPVTGFYGILTRAGIKRYQIAKGLPPVGVVGPQTLGFLNQ